jgi:hypothetical protein
MCHLIVFVLCNRESIIAHLNPNSFATYERSGIKSCDEDRQPSRGGGRIERKTERYDGLA